MSRATGRKTAGERSSLLRDQDDKKKRTRACGTPFSDIFFAPEEPRHSEWELIWMHARILSSCLRDSLIYRS
jgi:hypothetical protein